MPLRRTGELGFTEERQSLKKGKCCRGCVNDNIMYYRQNEGIYSAAIANLPRVSVGVKGVGFFFFKQRGQIVTSEREIKQNSKRAGK